MNENLEKKFSFLNNYMSQEGHKKYFFGGQGRKLFIVPDIYKKSFRQENKNIKLTKRKINPYELLQKTRKLNIEIVFI